MANIKATTRNMNERLLVIGGEIGVWVITLSAIFTILLAGTAPVFTIFSLFMGYGMSAKDVLVAVAITIGGFYVGFGTLDRIEKGRITHNG